MGRRPNDRLPRSIYMRVIGWIVQGYSDDFILSQVSITQHELNGVKLRKLRPALQQLHRLRQRIIERFHELREVSPDTVDRVGQELGIKRVSLAVWLGLTDVWQSLRSLHVKYPKNDDGRRTGWGVSMPSEPRLILATAPAASGRRTRDLSDRPQTFHYRPRNRRRFA